MKGHLSYEQPENLILLIRSIFQDKRTKNKHIDPNLKGKARQIQVSQRSSSIDTIEYIKLLKPTKEFLKIKYWVCYFVINISLCDPII